MCGVGGEGGGRNGQARKFSGVIGLFHVERKEDIPTGSGQLLIRLFPFKKKAFHELIMYAFLVSC